MVKDVPSGKPYGEFNQPKEKGEHLRQLERIRAEKERERELKAAMLGPLDQRINETNY